jgi:hypothetical protein
MKSVREFSTIYLHRLPVDGRKGINGLACLAEGSMLLSPLKGGLFVFTSKRRDTVKILYWDKTGFALWMKRKHCSDGGPPQSRGTGSLLKQVPGIERFLLGGRRKFADVS